MTSKELYKKGARVWIPNADYVWEGAVLEENYSGNTISVITDTGDKRNINIKSENDLPHLRNPTILIGQNDLTSLSFLHEPDVLYNLEIRFKERQVIYTYCGIILVAINPYHELPIYGSEHIRAYRGHSMGELEPHIFAVSEEAYAKLEREKCNISIIVSGESGAGKTVSAKYSMRYFAAVGGNESETHIEKKVLASSPIMEAIGNAKTIRNDNSSRFGKFTKLMFVNKNLSTMSLTGATMQTYLLEKSRVVSQASGERNYHIFYQLCAGREQFPTLSLDEKNSFKFLSQGSSSEKQNDDMRDLQNFKETLSALETLCFSQNEITNIFKVLAGILHLGNVEINESNQESCSVDNSDMSLNALCNILELNKSECVHWLTTRQIESINDIVKIPMSKETSEAARDALAKYLYSKLFNFIVQTINRNLSSDKNEEFFIGVLDIYGFETFTINSFEQFCINYANEKLQQQFNQHVFKLEQEEYLREGIVWTMIDFYDNQPCIDLIESKLGILDLLDEECRVPNGSDMSWVGKLNDKCSKYPHYEKARFGTSSFVIKHFSDTVQYEVHGFLEKNRDTVSKELVNVILSSKLDFCQILFSMDDDKSPVINKNSTVPSSKTRVSIDARSKTLPLKHQKQTVGSQFRESLSQLISTLHSTTPHYVRCIKPNDNKTPFEWDARKIVQQLRACGVLETVRISAAGFPSRWTYDDFYDRYRLLCKRADIVDWNVKATCTNIVKNWLSDDDKFRFGHTQIFFRAGQVAYLEQLRTDLRKKYIIRIQSAIRKFVCRKKYLRIRATTLGLQRYARGFLARKKAQEIRETRAATTIQRYIKGWYHRRQFLAMKKSILGIQRYGRGYLVRKRYAEVLNNFKAIQIQRFCRGYLARKRYKAKIRNITIVQACVRRRLAKRRLKELRTEARSISHLQTKYKGLENKIIELQQKFDVKKDENEKLKIENSAIPKMRNDLEVLKNVAGELKSLKSQLSDKEDQLISVQKMLDRELDEKMSLIDEKTKDDEKRAEEIKLWQIERQEMKDKIDELMRLLDEQAAEAAKQVDNENHLREKEILEKEVSRLQMIINTPGEIDSFKSSMYDINFNDKTPMSHEGNMTSTLERKFKRFFGFQNSTSSTSSTAEQKPSSSMETTAVILRLRKLLEEEKSKGDSLENELTWIRNKSSSTSSAGDSIRLSELEVENEKLRQDYELLRNSISRGVEHQEMEAQYEAMIEELKRRRDECIQLRTILSQQSQSLSNHNSSVSLKSYEGNELADALQAQRNANKQLEEELQALTEMHKMKLIELTKEIDNLRNEKQQLEDIFHEKLENDNENDIMKLRQRESYLKVELSRLTDSYVHSQESLTSMRKQLQELNNRNHKLSNALRDNGLNDAMMMNGSINGDLVEVAKKKNHKLQGILKHQAEDEGKIIQRLVTDLTTRTAITLLPSLPAYILFMCIRYTDLLNADLRVKSLLTNFLLSVKKTFKSSDNLDAKILWIVNSIRLQELMMQYGGHEQYMRLNTDKQNEQQLKNFDLSEYEIVIKETINFMYEVLIQRMQESIKPHIVPAILYHDETTKGKKRRGINSIESPGAEQKTISEPQSLVLQLEHFYNRFFFFGLDNFYVEQVFEQLFYFICAVALNNLMLRRDLCTWKTGMQLKYNVGILESWVKEKKMPDTVVSRSSSLTEAALLMQSRKSDADVESICEICPSLTPAQILKLVKSYTTDDCEDAISQNFIENLSKRLKAQENQESFTMNENEIRPLCVSFKYDDMKLEDIDIPEVLKLNNLVTKI